MKKLFPIFVLLCIGFVVIGSRASRPTASSGTSASSEAKVVDPSAAESLRQATARASNH